MWNSQLTHIKKVLLNYWSFNFKHLNYNNKEEVAPPFIDPFKLAPQEPPIKKDRGIMGSHYHQKMGQKEKGHLTGLLFYAPCDFFKERRERKGFWDAPTTPPPLPPSFAPSTSQKNYLYTSNSHPSTNTFANTTKWNSKKSNIAPQKNKICFPFLILLDFSKQQKN